MRYLFFVLFQLLLGYFLWRYVRRHSSKADRGYRILVLGVVLLVPIISIVTILVSYSSGGQAPELAADLVIGETYFVCLYFLFDFATHHRYQRVTALLCVCLTIPLIIGGKRNASEPITTHYTIHLPAIEGTDSLTIALVTDLHLGDLYGEESLMGLEQILDEERPDYTFIGGDLIDHHLASVDTATTAGYFSRMGGRKGRLYFIMGNHEYYSEDPDEVATWISSMGPLLRDSIVELRPHLYLIGREYYSPRAHDVRPLRHLTDSIPDDAVALLLQHRPHEYGEEDPEISDVDLVLHGHTHAGQIFPMQLLQPLLFRWNYGLHDDDGITYVISSGYGTSTTRLRVGTRSEIVLLQLLFDQAVGQ